MAERPGSYPPLDVLKPVADNLWIVDSGPFRVAGIIPVPVRMTVVRMRSGEMLLHSPTRWTGLLQRDIETLGPVRHLVAPNPFHWSFVRAWQSHCAGARVWAAEGTRNRILVRLKGPRIDAELAHAPPREWADELDMEMIRGRVFRELALFHRASRTAILTDLVVNLDPEKLPYWRRSGVSAVGSLAPKGRAPVYARIAYRMNLREAAPAARRVIAWNPARVIFSHGAWYQRDGAARLALSLAWLTGAER
ncbi:MAG TPA: DUF4336 domain-containing protein [Micropepsaceae bacterium]|nr:DUF4336 domain-containing protein [Micropepsaceae bacterium]